MWVWCASGAWASLLITLTVDDAVSERTCRLAEARGTTFELLTAAALRMLSEWDPTTDRI